MRSTLTAVLFLALAAPAFASDGVLEINQTCAVQTGCFPGDVAGLPVTINGTAGRSYRLTSDLVVPDGNTDGILVSTSDVGIDLNNFAIVGPVTCSGIPTTCTPATAGTGSGIERVSNSNSGTSVKNGSITGMGSNGLLLGDQAEVTGVRVHANRLNGITAGIGSILSGNVVFQNGSSGIFANAGSIVSGNTVFRNALVGISSINQGLTILENSAYDNGNNGIFAGADSTVSKNSTYSNGADGISTGAGCTVQGNTAASNTGFGLNLGSQTAYKDNTITTNVAGTVSGAAAVNMGGNSCSGTTTCP